MKNSLIKAGAWVSSLPVLLLPATVLATSPLQQAQTDLQAVGTSIDSTTTATTLPVLIGNVIAVLLSILGIIFVVLIVYSGFLYLTDMGEGKKVQKAKDILSRSIIGLVIIVAAYAISSFVIDALVDIA